MITNSSKTLYISFTNNLERRLNEHRSGLVPGFASYYNLKKLIYFEETTDVNAAIAREKQLKNWDRSKKIELIEISNPGWQDLVTGDPSAKVGMTNKEDQTL